MYGKSVRIFMMNYDFLHPEFLKLFYIVPVFWLFAIPGIRKLAIWRVVLAVMFRSIAFSMIVLALAGLSRVEKNLKEVDLIYLADVSDSIDAKGKEWMKRYIKDIEVNVKGSIKSELNIFAMNSKRIDSAEVITDSFDVNNDFTDLNPERTDIASSIISSLGRFREGATKRMVLLSDGNENAGDITKAALLAKNENVRIFTVTPPKTIFENNITLKKVLLPDEIPLGKTAEIKVVVDNENASPISGNVKLVLHQSNIAEPAILFKQWNDNFVPGLNIYKIKYRPDKKGFFRFETILECDGDINIEEDNIVCPLIVTGKSKILYVSGKKERKLFLPETLEERDIDVDIVTPDEIPDTILDMLAFESIIFSGVSKDMLKPGNMELIEQYVKDFGGGFVMLGGENSFIQGGYSGTPIEKILPVKMVGGEHRRKIDSYRYSLMLVVDKSASMTGKKMTFAKKAAIELVEQLGVKDKLGIIVFDKNPYMIQELRPVIDVKVGLVDKLSRLNPGGGTNIFPALKKAYLNILKSEAKKNHVILLSDGNSEFVNYNKEALIKSFKKANITISTIAIGNWFVNTTLLKDIAESTGGTFYNINDVSGLPKLMVKDVEYSLSKTDFHEETFYPVKVGSSPILKDISQEQLPPLKGFSITTSKENAETPLVTDIRGKNDPILANWRYGLGKTVAYMADAEARWSTDWIKWIKYNKFWSQSLRWAMKDIPESEYAVKVKTMDNVPYLFIESFYKDDLLNTGNRKENDKIKPVELKVRLYNTKPTRPGSEKDDNINVAEHNREYEELLLRQIGPGSYISPLDSFEPGNYFTNVLFTRDNKVLSSKNKGLIIPESKISAKPFDSGKFYNDVATMKKIANITGGKYNPEIEEITENYEWVSIFESLVKYLIPIMLGAFIIDVALRKL